MGFALSCKDILNIYALNNSEIICFGVKLFFLNGSLTAHQKSFLKRPV
jgi:hypothetical protein